MRTVSLLLCSAAVGLHANSGQPCRDTAEPDHCSLWMSEGECKNNQPYMSEHCRKSCGLCSPVPMEMLLRDVDENGDGTISVSELHARLKHLRAIENRGVVPTDPVDFDNPETIESLNSDEERQDFRTLDRDADGFLTFNETAEGEQSSSEAGIQYRVTADEDAEELTEEERSFQQQAHEWDELQFKLADANSDGKLDGREYFIYRHEDFTSSPEFEAHEERRLQTEAKFQMKVRQHVHTFATRTRAPPSNQPACPAACR